MRIETFKNLILTLLVATSIFLTWNIWTYQPKYEQIDQSQYIQGVSIKNKQSIGSIVKPIEILFHKNKQHFVTSNENEIDKVMKDLSKWTFYSLKDVSNSVSERQFLSFVHADGNTEIRFPDNVPLHLYNSILDINDKNYPKGEFDRIIFNVKNLGQKEAAVYFISYDKKKIYESKVNSSSLQEFDQNFYRFASLYEEYDEYRVNNNRMLFFPKNVVGIPQYKYKISQLDTKKFKDALFSDPNVVKQDDVTRGEEYTDGSRLLNIYLDTLTLSYINPIKEYHYTRNTSDILRKSIEFINDHAGWEDKYRYASFDAPEQMVTFRLYVKGWPVFNESGMSEIVQYWGQDDVYRYNRPIFTLDLQLSSENLKLASGNEALKELLQSKRINQDMLEDLSVGYELERDSDSQNIVNLVPYWYYRYNGVWKRVPFDEPGGELHGLE